MWPHMVPQFHKIGVTLPETFPNFKFDAPENVSGNRDSLDTPIEKWGLEQIFDVGSSRILTLYSLIPFATIGCR